MKIALRPRTIFKPSVVSMTAVSASFAAWLFPSFGVLRKGFDIAARPELGAFVVLACWYLLIFISFTVGEKLGGSLVSRPSATEGLLDLNSKFIYYGFTLLSTIGIAFTLIRIFRLLSLQQAMVFIALGQANELKSALYEDYSTGFASLRYVVLYPASLALYRIIRYRSFAAINLFNVLLLAVSALLLGSRLTLIATLLTAVFLLSFGRRSIRINVPKLATLATLLFLVLAVLNYSRNKDYYERNNLSFGLAGISEIVAYLGSPFQVSVGSAPVVDKLAAGGDQTYRDFVDVEINLNTNSAFVHLHEQIGYYSWLYIGLICLFMGFVFGSLASLGETVFLLPCGAILYGSAELWRLDLFRQGIFVVWFVIGIGFPAFLIGGQRLFTFICDVRGMSGSGYRVPRQGAA
jgi:hypothetical protein